MTSSGMPVPLFVLCADHAPTLANALPRRMWSANGNGSWESKALGRSGVLDDSFNIDRQRVLDICDLLIAKRLNHVPWIMINGIRAELG